MSLLLYAFLAWPDSCMLVLKQNNLDLKAKRRKITFPTDIESLSPLDIESGTDFSILCSI